MNLWSIRYSEKRITFRMNKIIPLILAGGSGTRLWPLSQVNKPKQYQLVLNNQMLLTQTLNRCQSNLFEKPVISTNIKHKPFIDEIDSRLYGKVIYEEIGKNTAASILTSCFLNENHDAYILVMPSDHYIPNIDYFNHAVRSCLEPIDEFDVITFGIKPKYASTQYGYIKIKNNFPFAAVESFHEKPSSSVAKEMIDSGNHLWNSGMFLFKISKILKQVKQTDLDIYDKLFEISQKVKYCDKEIHIASELWPQLENISFDVAVMEKIQNIGCYQYQKHWADLGDWKSVSDNSRSDQLIDSQNSFVKSYDRNHEVIGIGLKDILCIVANQKTLCINKNKLNTLKAILSNNEKSSLTSDKKNYKPWGWYESLIKLPNYQVKILHVNSNGKLSLQSHNQRSEHWIVIEGIAQVKKNNETFSLLRGQSIFLDKKDKHTLWNEESVPLKLVEVQIGDYLEEDDIVRYEDVYDRV